MRMLTQAKPSILNALRPDPGGRPGIRRSYHCAIYCCNFLYGLLSVLRVRSVRTSIYRHRLICSYFTVTSVVNWAGLNPPMQKRDVRMTDDDASPQHSVCSLTGAMFLCPDHQELFMNILEYIFNRIMPLPYRVIQSIPCGITNLIHAVMYATSYSLPSQSALLPYYSTSQTGYCSTHICTNTSICTYSTCIYV